MAAKKNWDLLGTRTVNRLNKICARQDLSADEKFLVNLLDKTVQGVRQRDEYCKFLTWERDDLVRRLSTHVIANEEECE